MIAMNFRRARATRRPRGAAADAAQDTVAALVALTYELLDAHADTGQLAVEDAGDTEWRNHLAYLRDLQRVARESLARAQVALP